MAVCFEVTIADWHVMSGGQAATVYKPDGRMGVMGVQDLDAYVTSEGATVVHLLWNGRDHYDTFRRPLQVEARWRSICAPSSSRVQDVTSPASREGKLTLHEAWVEDLDDPSDEPATRRWQSQTQ